MALLQVYRANLALLGQPGLQRLASGAPLREGGSPLQQYVCRPKYSLPF